MISYKVYYVASGMMEVFNLNYYFGAKCFGMFQKLVFLKGASIKSNPLNAASEILCLLCLETSFTSALNMFI